MVADWLADLLCVVVPRNEGFKVIIDAVDENDTMVGVLRKRKEPEN